MFSHTLNYRTFKTSRNISPRHSRLSLLIYQTFFTQVHILEIINPRIRIILANKICLSYILVFVGGNSIDVIFEIFILYFFECLIPELIIICLLQIHLWFFQGVLWYLISSKTYIHSSHKANLLVYQTHLFMMRPKMD